MVKSEAQNGSRFKRPRNPAAVEARIALAVVARRQGWTQAAPSTWANVMSLELGWFSPAEAKRYVQAAHEAGLVTGEEEWALTFDAREVEVPRGFRPSVEALPPPKPHDPFIDLIDRIESATGQRRADVLEAIADIQQRFGGHLHAEAAAVRLALEHDLDVQDAARDALTRLRTTGQ